MQVKPDQLFAMTGLKTGMKTALILCEEMPAEDLLEIRDLFVEMQDAAASALQRIDVHIERLGARAASAAETRDLAEKLGLVA